MASRGRSKVAPDSLALCITDPDTYIKSKVSLAAVLADAPVATEEPRDEHVLPLSQTV